MGRATRAAAGLALLAVTACGAPRDTSPASSTLVTTVVGTVRPASAISAAACDPDAMLPVVAGLLPTPPGVVAVEIRECQNGYARVIAVADQSTCPTSSSDPDPHCYENEQVFLVDRGGSWEVLTYGTGVDCRDPGSLLPEHVAACEALGLTGSAGAVTTLPGTR